MKTIALALALALPGVALAQSGPKRAQKPDMRFKLPDMALGTNAIYCPSGLTVLFQADHSHPIVSIMSIVDHGSGDDPKGKEGTAHFVEHTWFKSTQTVMTGWDENGNDVTTTLPPIMQVLNDYGTLMNATTRNDWTDYRTVFASEHLDMFLQLESARLTTPYVGVEAEAIETEREVIRNEWRRRNEQGFSQLFDFLYEEVYPENHPYHASSTKETLGRVDLPTLQKYFDDYYKAENTTIAVVGDFDIRESQSLLFKNFEPSLIHPKLTEKHIFRYPAPGVDNPERSNPDHWWFGAYDPDTYDPDLPGDQQDILRFPDPNDEEDQKLIQSRRRIKPEEPRDPVPDRGSKAVAYKEAPIDNRVVIAAWSLPGGFREDQQQLATLGGVANFALQQYFNPSNYRMYEEEWRPSDILGSQCFVQTERVHSTLMCLVEVKNRKLDPEQLAEKIVDQMPTIWNPDLVNYFENNVMPRSRNQQMAGILQNIDRVAYHFGGRAEDIVTHAHYTTSPSVHSAQIEQTNKLTMFDVAKIGQQYLTRDRAVSVVIDPLPSSEIDKTGEGSAYAGSSDEESVIVMSDEFKTLTDDDVKRAFVKPDFSNIIDKTLDNGLRVLIVPHGGAPVAWTGVITHGGNLSGKAKDLNWYGWNFADSDAIDTFGFGLGGEDPLRIAGNFSQGQRDSYAYMRLRHAGLNTDSALWMLREQIERVKPDLEGKSQYVKRYRDRREASWTSRSSNWLMSEMTSKHKYPENPERWVTSWEEAGNLLEWGSAEVNGHWADHWQPGNATVVVTGNIEAEVVLEQVEKYFGGWKPNAGATKDVEALSEIKTPAMSKGSKILVFDDPEATQTQVNGNCRLSYEPKHREAVDVLKSLFISEVFTRLRVKEGLAYSPVGFASRDVGDAANLGFRSLAVNDGVGRTLEVMKELVRRGEDGEYDNDLIRIHKLREARNTGLELQSTDQMASWLTYFAYSDKEPTDVYKTGERLAAVDASQIKDLMTGCSDRLLFTLQGPADVVTPQLDKLGYDYEIVDWKGEGEARFQKHDPKGFKKYLKRKAKNEKKKAAAADDGAASAE